jgi:hypothetical protein
MSTNNNNKQQAAAAATTTKHLNPFYIDPGELQQLEWEGDYEWDDEYEAEGLLRNTQDVENNHHSATTAASKKNDSASSYNKNNRHQLPPPHVKGVGRALGRGGHQKRWICIVGFFALAIFFILSSTNSNTNKNNDTDTDSNSDGGGEASNKVEQDEFNKSKKNKKNNPDDDDTTPTATIPGAAAAANNEKNNENEPSALSYVHRVVLLGERQTGVDAFKNHWSSCFPTRNFTTFLTRKTYWFQDLSHPPADVNSDEERILFVLFVRNPYTWVEAMRGHPLHMSAHVNQTTQRALSWKDFVTQPWTPLTPTAETETAETGTCQLDFAPNQVLPCHVPTDNLDDAHPPDIYELKAAAATAPGTTITTPNDANDNLAFASILELRAAKLKHFVYDLPRAYQGFNLMATPLQTSATILPSLIDNNVLIIHYEDDLVLSMQKLEQVTGWQPVEHCHQAKRFPPSITLENLDRDYIQFLSNDETTWLEWELEAQIGYQKVV